MRCDLHVHSIASGMCNTPVLNRICRESYNQPAEVYTRLKQLGMTLVTLTDHDAIDAGEELRKYSDFLLSEEVTVQMPGGTEMHLGVYGITERDHVEIQRRRKDFISLMMYLTERKLFFSVNHVFSGLTGRRSEEDFSWFASYAPAFETRNGQMWPQANESAARLARRLGKIAVGGSDSHTLAGAGRTYTEVPGARTADEFFGGLRAGRRASPWCTWELREADRGRVSHRVVSVQGKAVDACTYAAVPASASIHCGSLAERNAVLPEMVGCSRRWGETAKNVLGYGFELRGQLGLDGLKPWLSHARSGDTSNGGIIV